MPDFKPEDIVIKGISQFGDLIEVPWFELMELLNGSLTKESMKTNDNELRILGTRIIKSLDKLDEIPEKYYTSMYDPEE
jgi:hypothetical protein